MAAARTEKRMVAVYKRSPVCVVDKESEVVVEEALLCCASFLFRGS